MEKPTPKTAFGGKPMGGLARIINEYFPVLDDPSAEVEVPAELQDLPVRDEPYISSHGTHCTVCGTEIKVMCFHMTGVCSEICRKVRAGEIKAPATNEA